MKRAEMKPLDDWNSADTIPLDEIKEHMAALAFPSGDIESDHWDADVLLCGALRQLGQGELVDSYLKVGKWFA